MFVTQVHQFLGVRIVAGPEGVSTQPQQQVDVLHHERVVQTLSSDLQQFRSEGVFPLTRYSELAVYGTNIRGVDAQIVKKINIHKPFVAGY